MQSKSAHRRPRTVAAVLTAACLVAPAAAGAIAPGDTKYDYPGTAPSAALTTPQVAVSEARGDTKADAPGASRSPVYDAPSIHVFRPQTTIVRDVDETLPIVLSGAALLLALGGAGLVMRRTGSVPHVRRSH